MLSHDRFPTTILRTLTQTDRGYRFVLGDMYTTLRVLRTSQRHLRCRYCLCPFGPAVEPAAPHQFLTAKADYLLRRGPNKYCTVTECLSWDKWYL